MDDTTLQRILQALERIEAELKARRPAPKFPPQQPAPYYAPRWFDGQPGWRDGRPFDPFIVTC